MPDAIDFYFDFSSPYGYLASLRIDDIGARHGREVIWRPYLMGAAMKLTGARPLVERPMVTEYARRDLARSARRQGAPFSLPDPFPVATVAAGRLYYWLNDSDPIAARRLAAALLGAYFVEGRNIGEPATVIEIAARQGIERTAASDALADAQVKQRLREATDRAIALGIFGSPWVVVDGEPFWGNDRLDEVERWLEGGGW